MIILMGVSGCGKTTIGEQLSVETGLPFYDADDFHPDENIVKMNNNIALDDTDRLPWLNTLAINIKVWENRGGAILACSALKESYRTILESNTKNILWVYLSGSFDLIKNRLENRHGHYMKSGLLKSQFNTLEVPYYALHVDISKSRVEITNTIMLRLKNNE